MEAVVHIGLPKTGTTSIQSALMSNRAGLRRQGFLFLPYHSWLKSQPEYTILGFERADFPLPDGLVLDLTGATTPGRQAKYTARFERWLDRRLARSAAHTFIISSEFISVHPRPVALRALVEWLQTRFTRVRFVLFLRDQADLITGIYSDALRYPGSTQSLAEFSKGRKPINFPKRLRVLENTIGRENLSIEIMDRSNPTPLLTQFSRAADIPELRASSARRANKSLTSRGAKWMVAINRNLNWLPLPRSLILPLRAGLAIICERLTAGSPRLTLSETDRARIRDQVAATNAKLRRRRFPDCSTLFSVAKSDVAASKLPSQASA